jgi:hypothetical protein
MHQQAILRRLGYVLIALGAAFAAAAQAAANVQSVRGEVRVGDQRINANDRITSGATITTGAGSQAVLKFDDGQQVVLNENTAFRITDFRFRKDEPRGDRAVFDLLQGALRMITGLVGSRNQGAFQLRVPQATIGIRGTDFMVAIVNPAVIAVNTGAVAASNAGGTAVWGAGSFGTVAGPSSLGVAITASQVPAAASAAFSSMNAAAGVVAGGMAPAATLGDAVAPATSILPTAAVIGGVIAVGAGISGGADKATTHH